VTFPRNIVSAFLEIQASGNYQEEFWYSNLPNKYLSDLPSGTTYILFAFISLPSPQLTCTTDMEMVLSGRYEC
jgi:hypothetical protein